MPTLQAATGQTHVLMVRALDLDHRYHDDAPVEGAEFTVKFSNGLELSGKLDDQGRARILGAPSGSAEVSYGPDARDYAPVEQKKNPDFKASLSDADVDGLFEKYQSG